MDTVEISNSGHRGPRQKQEKVQTEFRPKKKKVCVRDTQWRESQRTNALCEGRVCVCVCVCCTRRGKRCTDAEAQLIDSRHGDGGGF